jgi:hypothetical protein
MGIQLQTVPSTNFLRERMIACRTGKTADCLIHFDCAQKNSRNCERDCTKCDLARSDLGLLVGALSQLPDFDVTYVENNFLSADGSLCCGVTLMDHVTGEEDVTVYALRWAKEPRSCSFSVY